MGFIRGAMAAADLEAASQHEGTPPPGFGEHPRGLRRLGTRGGWVVVVVVDDCGAAAGDKEKSEREGTNHLASAIGVRVTSK